MSDVATTQPRKCREADAGSGKEAGTAKGGIFGLAIPEKVVTVLGWLAVLILVAVVAAWLWALWALHNRVEETELSWARLVSIFGFLHSVASGAIGALLGVAIQQGKVGAANAQVADARTQVSEANSRAVGAETTANASIAQAMRDKERASRNVELAQQQSIEAVNLIRSTSRKVELGMALASAVLTEAANASASAQGSNLNLHAQPNEAVKIARELRDMA